MKKMFNKKKESKFQLTRVAFAFLVVGLVLGLSLGVGTGIGDNIEDVGEAWHGGYMKGFDDGETYCRVEKEKMERINANQ